MQEKTWNRLLEFESRDLIERYIRQKHNRDASARQILEVSSNFIQGREYFRHAENAAMTVKPLLIFYGVAALSRGLVLALWPHVSESGLQPSHGLAVSDWQEPLKIKDFGELNVIITKGTFYDLLTATDNRSYLKHHTSGITAISDYEVPPTNTKISFKNLLKTLPDLKTAFELWCGELPLVASVQTITPLPNDRVRHAFPSYVGIETIESLFRAGYGDAYVVSREVNVTNVETANVVKLQLSQSFYDGFNMGIGEAAITSCIAPNTHLNSLSQFYCGAYFLGMLCRYFPSIWISLGRTEKGDAIYPLIINLLGMIEKEYPQLILEFLDGPYKWKPTGRKATE